MTDYSPIACSLYSRYELWCMHRRRLHLEWTRDDGAAVTGERRAVDMLTRGGGEFLVAEDEHGRREEIRLDRIATAREIRAG